MSQNTGKKDGFRDEKYYILPIELFAEYMEHPMIRTLYLTDVGFFPKAKEHYREREEGADQHILIYCTDGKGVIEVEDEVYPVEKNQAFCIPAAKKHRYYADERKPWSILWMHFQGENASFFPIEERNVITIASRHSNNRMITLFQILFRVLDRNYTLGNFIYISQLTSMILSEVYFREKVDESTTYDRHVTEVIKYMYQNIGKNLSLQDISEEVELSKSYLNAIFKQQTGHAPVDFFIRMKMQEACKLLKSTDLYIYEVSERMGYTDQYYFSRIFKKVVGMSPKEYQNGEYFYQI